MQVPLPGSTGEWRLSLVGQFVYQHDTGAILVADKEQLPLSAMRNPMCYGHFANHPAPHTEVLGGVMLGHAGWVLCSLGVQCGWYTPR